MNLKTAAAELQIKTDISETALKATSTKPQVFKN
jgi:hypothetical protein